MCRQDGRKGAYLHLGQRRYFRRTSAHYLAHRQPADLQNPRYPVLALLYRIQFQNRRSLTLTEHFSLLIAGESWSQDGPSFNCPMDLAVRLSAQRLVQFHRRAR